MRAHHGEFLRPRTMPARPETLLKAMAPSREALVVAVAGIVTWYGLADLWARAGLPLVLGQALSMQAMHGGKATHAKSDAHKLAVFLRGALRPQASGSPAARRATRALLRRRMPLRRTRVARWAHLQHTHSQSHRPELGQQLADTGQRDGGAARCLAPAVRQSVAGDLALLAHEDRRRREVALPSVETATQPKAHARSRRHAVPGLGTIVRVVWLDALHESTRLPRGQDGVASCRLGTGAQASAGKRDGTAGNKSGHASLPWAFAAAAVRLLRHQPQGQQVLARWEQTHGPGTAGPSWVPKVARAVSSRLTRDPVCARDRCLNGSGSGVGAPAASRDAPGLSLKLRPGTIPPRCVRERATGQRPGALLPRGCWAPGAGSLPDGEGRRRLPGAAPRPHLSLTGAPHGCSPACAEDGRRGQLCC